MSKKGDSNNKRPRTSTGSNAEPTAAAAAIVDDANPPLTMPQIQTRIRQLLNRLPTKEETAALSVDDIPTLELWCKTVRTILRNYNLSLNFVAIATYQWEPDRPGHTGQSLGALRGQITLSTAQTNILSSHVGRVLTPAFDPQLVARRTVTKENGDKEETFEYKNELHDPEMLQLNREQLVDEAIYKRQMVVSAMELMIRCMDDYLKAEAGAAGGDGQRFSMAY